MPGVSRLGDTSTHGGSIISSASVTKVNGILVARVGDSFSCPLHGVWPIVNGSGNYKCEGAITAVIGSTVGCGATLTTGSGNTFAPLVSPSGAIILGSGPVGGPLG